MHGSSHKASVPMHDCGNQAVEERLQNIEAHLRLQTGVYGVLILILVCHFILVMITVVKLGMSVNTDTAKKVNRSIEGFSSPQVQ